MWTVPNIALLTERHLLSYSLAINIPLLRSEAPRLEFEIEVFWNGTTLIAQPAPALESRNDEQTACYATGWHKSGHKIKGHRVRVAF